MTNTRFKSFMIQIHTHYRTFGVSITTCLLVLARRYIRFSCPSTFGTKFTFSHKSISPYSPAGLPTIWSFFTQSGSIIVAFFKLLEIYEIYATTQALLLQFQNKRSSRNLWKFILSFLLTF